MVVICQFNFYGHRNIYEPVLFFGQHLDYLARGFVQHSLTRFRLFPPLIAMPWDQSTVGKSLFTKIFYAAYALVVLAWKTKQ